VFHQSKCICAIKRILSTTAMYVSSPSFTYFSIPCYCDAYLNSSALRVGVKTLLNTITQYNLQTFGRPRVRFPDIDPCIIAFARETVCLDTCPNHCNLRRLTISISGSSSPIMEVTSCVTEMLVRCAVSEIWSNLWKHRISNAAIHFSRLGVRVQLPHP